jgi:hypothetical protein
MFFQIYTQITRKFGGIALDSLDGEKGISYLCEDIIDLFRTKISFSSPSIMSRLLVNEDNKEMQYDQFKSNLEKDNSIFPQFSKFLEDTVNKGKLSDYSFWLHELINFETNYAYRIWYGKEEKLDLDSNLKDYLKCKGLESLTRKINISGRNWAHKKILRLVYWFVKVKPVENP